MQKKKDTIIIHYYTYTASTIYIIYRRDNIYATFLCYFFFCENMLFICFVVVCVVIIIIFSSSFKYFVHLVYQRNQRKIKSFSFVTTFVVYTYTHYTLHNENVVIFDFFVEKIKNLEKKFKI